MSEQKIIVFGEYHTPQIRDWIESRIINLIRSGKKVLIFSEELGPYYYHPDYIEGMRLAIQEHKYSISDRTLLFGIKYKVPIYGIDMSWNKEDFPHDRKAIEPEALAIITSTMSMYPNIDIFIIIIGDIHIRDDSVIYQYLKDKAHIYHVTDPTLKDNKDLHPNSRLKDIEIREEYNITSLEALSNVKDKRKKAEARILDVIDKLDPSKYNGDRYRKLFKLMTDDDFTRYMQDIRDKKRKLAFYVPNMKIHIRMEDILAVAKELGVKFFERLRLWDNVTKRYYLTPQEYLVLKLPVRRLKQYLESKMSIPESDSHLDLFSGQVIKPDKGSSISLVELQTMLSKNLDNPITELSNLRGGNTPGYAAMKGQLEENGLANISSIDTNSRVRSVVVTNAYFTAMALQSNL
jgi:hypothetical protein